MKFRSFFTVVSLIVLTACNAGWTPMSNGNDLSGWTDVHGNPVPESLWCSMDGVIVSHPDIDAESSGDIQSAPAGTMDIISAGVYKDFKLKLEFKLEAGSNGGIKYFINPGTFSNPSVGFEYQVIDDEKFGEYHFDINNVQTTASLYDILSSNKQDADFKPYEWNQAMIVVRGGRVEHWLNGAKVLELDRFSPSFDVLVVNSKFRNEKGFGKLEGGHILLQDHGCRVYYRNIRIKELK